MAEIRHITENDAQALLALRKAIDAETEFMLFEPGERQTTVEDQRDRLKALLARDNQMIFVAEHEGQLVGFLEAVGGGVRRSRHSVYIVIGIRNTFTDQGIGASLFVAMESWARARKVHRLELTVMAHNERAIHLYRKMGFEIEGTKFHALCVNGDYVNEYCMSKLLY